MCLEVWEMINIERVGKGLEVQARKLSVSLLDHTMLQSLTIFPEQYKMQRRRC